MELPSGRRAFDCVEVRFKGTRKDFYRFPSSLELKVGNVVAVESVSGHDIGIVTLTGELVKMQMKRKGVDPNSRDLRKVYRLAKENDIETWKDAQKLERETMLKARQISKELGLEMKISDVEYQGDKTKATFYYTADDRVDFRELIKVLASEFSIRIDMRQIGARQEAGRVGGIGSCGRELCCSTWLTDFRSVSTSAARYQQLSINPMKLAGQCGKLKCCLNYELDSYMEAAKNFPKSDVKLETQKGVAVHMKTDIFKGMMWFAYLDNMAVFIPMTVGRVKEVMEMNRNGKKPEDLKEYEDILVEAAPDFENVVGQDSLTRFDKKAKGTGRRRGKGGRGGNNRGAQHAKGKQSPKGQQGNRQAAPKGQQNNASGGSKPKSRRKGGRRPNKPNPN